jgi:hypothetical protein
VMRRTWKKLSMDVQQNYYGIMMLWKLQILMKLIQFVKLSSRLESFNSLSEISINSKI